MTEKRFRIIYHDEYDYELNYIEENGKRIDLEDICDLLNEQHEIIQRLQESLNYNGAYINAKKKRGAWKKGLIDELRESNQMKDDYIVEIDMDRKNLLKENEKLKAQLYCNPNEGVCVMCKYHYLEKDKAYEKFYTSKCKKDNQECSTSTLRYCNDFELKR